MVGISQEIWCSNHETGRFDEKLGESRENRESWQVCWRLRNKHRNSILMTVSVTAHIWVVLLKQIPPSAQPIRSITQNWVVTSHLHGKFYSHSSDMASSAGLCSPFSNSHTPFCSLKQDSDAWTRDGLRRHFAGKQKVSSGYPFRNLVVSLA